MVLYAGAIFHAGADVHDLRLDDGDSLGNGLGGKTSGECHRVAAQPFAGLPGHRDFEGDPCPTLNGRDEGLDQYYIGRRDSRSQEI
jgi:hypothetical protein